MDLLNRFRSARDCPAPRFWRSLGLTLSGLALTVLPGLAQTQPSTDVTPAVVPAPAAPPSVTKPLVMAGPAWAELTPMQREALLPLATQWPRLSEFNKRKWLALSQNYHQLPETERTRLHSRMSEWVELSMQERTQARINFVKANKLSAEEKSDKWQAYQALSQEEKHELALQGPRPPVTAIALKPVSPQRLTAAPAGPSGPAVMPNTGPVRNHPRIASDPNQIDRHTLLPRPPASH